VALHPNGNVAYVLEDHMGDLGGYQTVVKVVCLLTNQVLTTIPLRASNYFFIWFGGQLAVTPDGKFLYVVLGRDIGSDTLAKVLVISTTTNKIILTLPLSFSYQFARLAISPDSKYVYVNGNGAVSVIATATNSVVKKIDTGACDPFATSLVGSQESMAMTPNGAFLYISDPVYGRVSVVSTAESRVVDVIPVPDPQEMSVTPDGKHVWVSINFESWTPVDGGFGEVLTGDAKIAIIETATNNVVSTFADPAIVLTGNKDAFTFDFAFTPDGSLAYFIVGNDGPGDDTKIHMMETATKKVVQELAFDPGHHFAGLLAPMH
jgi:YVTN family beta-propeller protein